MKLFTKASIRLLACLMAVSMTNMSLISVASANVNSTDDTIDLSSIEAEFTSKSEMIDISDLIREYINKTLVKSEVDNSTTTTDTTTSVITTSSTTETSATTTAIPTEATTEESATTEIITEQPYVVYKPSTHYVHMSSCRWYNNECVRIENTEGIECIRCSECKPDVEIVNEYVPPVTTTTTTTTEPVTEETTIEEVTDTEVVDNNEEGSDSGDNSQGLTSLKYITDTERIYICNVVAAEYGADWVPIYDKAMIVCGIMNRVNHGGWSGGLPSTVYNVLMAPYQFNPDYVVPYYRRNVTQSCIDAVEYYFEHIDEFPTNIHSWCGDGRYNYFR